jgi:flagellar biosynthesis chaperone FliJ
MKNNKFEKKQVSINELNLEIKEYKNKYQQVAEKIYALIGGKENYTNP